MTNQTLTAAQREAAVAAATRIAEADAAHPVPHHFRPDLASSDLRAFVAKLAEAAALAAVCVDGSRVVEEPGKTFERSQGNLTRG